MSDVLKDDSTGWNRLMKSISAGDSSMVVGWPDSAHEGGITNAALALIHEFGAQPHAAESGIMAATGATREEAHKVLAESGAGIPARAPLRTAWEANKDTYLTMLQKGLSLVLEGKKTFTQVLAIIGLRAENDVKNAIRSRLPPPLAESTLASRKSGGDTPLVATGQFLNSVKSIIRKGPGSAG